MNIAEKYIELKYGNATKKDWKELMAMAAREIQTIKDEKSDIFTRFSGVHGRFQHSQLDVLDIRETKACAIFDNAMEMMGKSLH